MSQQLLKDIAERAVMTFAQAFLAVYAVTDLSSAKGAALAGVAAAISVVKGAIASQIGRQSASLVPSV